MSFTSTIIPKIGECVTCHICEKDVPEAYIKEHLASVIHKCNADLVSISLERTRNLVKAKNAFLPRELINGKYCDLCNCDYENPNEHFDSDKHCKLRTLEDIMPNICALFKDAENNLNALDDMLKCLQVNLKGEVDNKIKMRNKIKATGLLDKNDKDVKINENKTYCNVCKVFKNTQGFYAHIQCRKHLLMCLVNNIPIPVIDGTTFCDVCGVYKKNGSYDAHLNSAKHKTRSFLIDGHDTKYIECIQNLKKWCKICKINVDDDINEVNKHIKSVGHIFKYVNILNDNNITKFVNGYFCSKCEIFVDDIVKHLNSNVSYFHPILNLDKTSCELCKTRVPSSFTEHEKSKKHFRKQYKFISKLNINYIDFNLEELDMNSRLMITVKDKILKCMACDETLDTTDILNHLKQHGHHE